jgi:hypothetical protein
MQYYYTDVAFNSNSVQEEVLLNFYSVLVELVFNSYSVPVELGFNSFSFLVERYSVPSFVFIKGVLTPNQVAGEVYDSRNFTQV